MSGREYFGGDGGLGGGGDLCWGGVITGDRWGSMGGGLEGGLGVRRYFGCKGSLGGGGGLDGGASIGDR